MWPVGMVVDGGVQSWHRGYADPEKRRKVMQIPTRFKNKEYN